MFIRFGVLAIAALSLLALAPIAHAEHAGSVVDGVLVDVPFVDTRPAVLDATPIYPNFSLSNSLTASYRWSADQTAKLDTNPIYGLGSRGTSADYGAVIADLKAQERKVGQNK